MEELQEQGVLRSIGVSNYDSTLLYEVVLLGGTRPQVISLISGSFSVAGEPGASHTETSPAGSVQCRTKFRRAPSGFSNNPIQCHVFA